MWTFASEMLAACAILVQSGNNSSLGGSHWPLHGQLSCCNWPQNLSGHHQIYSARHQQLVKLCILRLKLVNSQFPLDTSPQNLVPRLSLRTPPRGPCDTRSRKPTNINPQICRWHSGQQAPTKKTCSIEYEMIITTYYSPHTPPK